MGRVQHVTGVKMARKLWSIFARSAKLQKPSACAFLVCRPPPLSVLLGEPRRVLQYCRELRLL